MRNKGLNLVIFQIGSHRRLWRLTYYHLLASIDSAGSRNEPFTHCYLPTAGDYMRTSDVCCGLYLKESNIIFFGGVVLALDVTKSNLHRRIALIVILIVVASILDKVK